MISSHLEVFYRPYLEQGLFPGCVTGWIEPDGHRCFLGYGQTTDDEDASGLFPETIYDVASVTKSIPTALIAHRFIDRGLLKIKQKIVEFLPELEGPYRDQIQLEHLLSFGLEYKFALSSLKDKRADEILHEIMKADLASPPGSVRHYSNPTSVLLTLLLERVGGKKFEELAQVEVFDPLEMNSTTFKPDAKDPSIVPTERDPWRGRVVKGEVHDESAYALRPIMVSGSAGLFTNANDLLNATQMLMQNGRWGTENYLSSDSMKRIQQGMGFEISEPWLNKIKHLKPFGKTGFTGCFMAVVPARQWCMVFLSNSTWPRRKEDKFAMQTFRRETLQFTDRCIQKEIDRKG